MNFSGYVPLNRGLIEHTMTGRMTNNEALAFVWLLMLADRKTGSYTINAPTLRAFLPDMKNNAAQDALASLERKGYIYRDVKSREKVPYRYWIDGFTPTDGPHKGRRLDLSQVLGTKDTSKLRYVTASADTHAETGVQTGVETHAENVNNNKTGEREGEKRYEKEIPSCTKDEGALNAQRVRTEGAQRAGAVRHGAPQCAPTALTPSTALTAPELPAGWELRDGYAGVGVYGADGLKKSPTQVSNKMREQNP